MLALQLCINHERCLLCLRAALRRAWAGTVCTACGARNVCSEVLSKRRRRCIWPARGCTVPLGGCICSARSAFEQTAAEVASGAAFAQGAVVTRSIPAAAAAAATAAGRGGMRGAAAALRQQLLSVLPEPRLLGIQVCVTMRGVRLGLQLRGALLRGGRLAAFVCRCCIGMARRRCKAARTARQTMRGCLLACHMCGILVKLHAGCCNNRGVALLASQARRFSCLQG